MSYGDIQDTPWEHIEWIYNRHLQELIDLQKKQNEKNHQYF